MIKKLPLLITILILTCFLFNCNKESECRRSVKIEKQSLAEGDNVVFDDGFLQVHAVRKNRRISFIAKTNDGLEGTMKFSEKAMSVGGINSELTVEGEAECDCKYDSKGKKTGQWECVGKK